MTLRLLLSLLLLPALALPAQARRLRGGLEPKGSTTRRAVEPGSLVLVLPLAPEDAAQEPDWLSAGAAAMLAEALRAAGYRIVDAGARDEALEEAGLAAESRLSLASACQLARGLGAETVITGGWSAEGTSLTIEARAIDVDRLKLVREGRSSGHSDTLSQLLGSLALAIAGEEAREADARSEIERLSAAPQAALIAWMQAAAEPDLATQHLEAALQAAPDFAPALLALAEARLDAGQPEQVGRLVSRVKGSTPSQIRAALLEGRAALALGDVGTALALLSDAAARWPDREPLLWLGEAHLAASERAQAAAAARRALELSPGDPAAEDLLGRATGGSDPS